MILRDDEVRGRRSKLDLLEAAGAPGRTPRIGAALLTAAAYVLESQSRLRALRAADIAALLRRHILKSCATSATHH